MTAVPHTYGRDVDGIDPLYPNVIVCNALEVSSENYLDAFNPTLYDGASIAILMLAPPDGDTEPWDNDEGVFQGLYHPTTTSLSDRDTGLDPINDYVLSIYNPYASPLQQLAVNIKVDTDELEIVHTNDGSHDSSVIIANPDPPVAGQPYKARVRWKVGTYDAGTDVVSPDGYVRVYINSVLVYEVTDISLRLNRQPISYDWTERLCFQLGTGFLGALDYFTIGKPFPPEEEDVEVDLEDEELGFEFDPHDRQAVGLVWVEIHL